MPALVKSSVGSDNGTTWEDGTTGENNLQVSDVDRTNGVVEIAELAG